MNEQWEYNEFQQVGRDYGARDEVEVYDATHADFRDTAAEAREALDRLGLQPGEILVEYGTGTGTLAIEAARRGAVVHAVDISEAMLARAKQKAESAGVQGISFHHEEYSTYDWVMDGLLARAGFRVEERSYRDGVLGTYLCSNG